MNEVVKNYYLGLDIGTNSVGWAVTDDEYNLCKFKKKDMWGIRLFRLCRKCRRRQVRSAAGHTRAIRRAPLIRAAFRGLERK